MKSKIFFSFFVLIAFSGSMIGYLTYDNFILKKNTLTLEDELLQTRSDFFATAEKLNSEIKNLNTDIKNLGEILESTKQELATTTVERDDFQAKYSLEKNRMDDFDSQINNIQGKMGTLEKLSQTDSELLKKYSKIYFLNENYVPESFVKIDSNYTFNSKEDYLIYSKIWPFLSNLMLDTEENEIDIKIISAYRSFYDQNSLKSSYKMIYGSGANKFSADQGYSEHQLGTTVDFTTSQNGASYSNFEKTPAYLWLSDNAYKYGFILSYPKDNKYYQYESWHWRFVGRDLAQKLHDEGKNFYDLDQREIDQYLISFFD